MADIIKTATRDAYGKALIELGHKDKNVIVMDSDLAEATRTGKFKKEFPDRFFDSGIADVYCCRFSCDRSYRICKFVCNVRCRESL